MSIYIPGTGFATQGPCPDGFHVPLNTEWQAIYDAGISLGAWTSSGGTNLSTYLKMPMAGDRSYNRSVYNSVGSYGSYWSSSPYVSNTDYTYYLYFNTSSVYPQGWGYSAYGRTVRCFKDSPTTPTTSWTKLYGTSIESGGIFWSSSDGLISISADGTTWYTLMDKNLGATTVWNSGDTLTDANCGNVFQRGNNYAFPGTLSSASITSSSTRVNTSTYGPGNYYSSSTWIEYAGDWSNPSNNNLWGGTDGNVPIMKEAKNIYIGEYERPPVSLTFEYTGSDQHYTILRDGNYKITAKGAGSRTAAGGLGEGIFSLTGGTVLSIMVGANGGNGNGVKYGFGGSANGGTNAAGGGLSGVFTGGGAITASDSARALVIGGGAGGSSYGTGGAGGGNNGGTGTGSYGTAGAGGTPTGHGSTGNNGSYQFSGGNGSGTYGYGGGGGWRGGNGSIGDGSGDDDKGGGGGSGYVLSTASSKVVTLGGGSAAGNNGVVTIVEIR